MHGVIFAELKKYVVARLGAQAWNDLLRESGMAGTIFLPHQVYDDAAMVALVGTASRLTGKAPGDILEDFGEFIAGDLIAMYKAQVDPRWKALDLIEHTEQLIHRTVRVKQPGAEPPMLGTRREGPTRLLLTYTSPRRLCGVAKGLARGVGKHYNELVKVQEPRCMHRGDAACEIRIETVG